MASCGRVDSIITGKYYGSRTLKSFERKMTVDRIVRLEQGHSYVRMERLNPLWDASALQRMIRLLYLLKRSRFQLGNGVQRSERRECNSWNSCM
jgi:hypothetical protein